MRSRGARWTIPTPPRAAAPWRRTRHRPHLYAGTCKPLLLALVLAPAASWARLALDSGEVLDAPRYGFTRADAGPVSAPIVLTEADDWHGCPPEFVGEGGASRLRGALVVAVNPRTFVCSPERHARAAAALGAAGWVSFGEQHLALAPVPGYIARLWHAGDARALDGLPGADITSSAAAPLVALLRAGGAARGTLVPSSSAYDRLFTPWLVVLYRIVLGAGVALSLEMVLSRLLSFLRADGRLRATIPQLMLGLDALATGLRLAQIALDPLFLWPGWLPYAGSVSLWATPISLSSLSTFLFLVYFCEASDAAGLASLSIGTRFYRLLALLVLALVVGMEAVLIFEPTAFGVFRSGQLRILWSTTLLPIPICAFALYAHRRTRASLLAALAPPAVLRRLVAVMRRVLALVVLSALLGPAWQPCLFRPWLRLLQPAPLTVLHAHLSVTRLRVFSPVGVRPAPGPLERACAWLLASASACVARSCAAPEGGSTRKSVGDDLAGPADANVRAARLPRSSTPPSTSSKQHGALRGLELLQEEGRRTRSRTVGASARSFNLNDVHRRGSERSGGSSNRSSRRSSAASSISAMLRRARRSSMLTAETAERAPKPPSAAQASAKVSTAWAEPAPPAKRVLVEGVTGGSASGECAASCVIRITPADGAAADAQPGAVGTGPQGSGGSNRWLRAHVSAPAKKSPRSSLRSPIAKAVLVATRFRHGVRVHPHQAAPDQPQPAKNTAGRASAALGSPCSSPTSRSAVGPAGGYPPHLGLGVSLAFLREFAAAHGLSPSDTSYRAGEIVREITAASRLSLCELKRLQSTEGGWPAVRPATLFVSHAQACSFVDMLDAVALHMELHSLDPARTYLWLDLCCIRQHRVDADVLHIGAILRHVGTMVTVLAPWDRPVALTRVWCLYEVMMASAQRSGRPHGAAEEQQQQQQPQQPPAAAAAEAGWSASGGGAARPVEFSLALSRTQREHFLRALDRDRKRVLSALTSFDARHAEASLADDRARILELIVSKFAPSGLSAAQLRARGVERDPADTEAALDAFNATVRAAIQAAVSGLSWSVVTHAAAGVAGGTPPSPNSLRHAQRRSAAAARSDDWAGRHVRAGRQGRVERQSNGLSSSAELPPSSPLP